MKQDAARYSDFLPSAKQLKAMAMLGRMPDFAMPVEKWMAKVHPRTHISLLKCGAVRIQRKGCASRALPAPMFIVLAANWRPVRF